jgi:hypothetical protein
VLGDEFTEARPFIQFAHKDESAIRRDPRPLEIDLEGGMEGELKGSVLFITRWVLTSGASSSR